MPTILVKYGLEFRVFTKDHQPPHVHVVQGEKVSVVIRLGDSKTRPWVHEIFGMKRQDIRKAIDVVEANQEYFLEEWSKHHG